MKKFQGAAEMPWAVEVRPILREKTPDRPAASCPLPTALGRKTVGRSRDRQTLKPAPTGRFIEFLLRANNKKSKTMGTLTG
jgi:hypothetical protein